MTLRPALGRAEDLLAPSTRFKISAAVGAAQVPADVKGDPTKLIRLLECSKDIARHIDGM